jgi:hypothetical protein
MRYLRLTSGRRGCGACGLPVRFFSGSIALDGRRPVVLYAGTEGRGIYRLQLDAE